MAGCACVEVCHAQTTTTTPEAHVGAQQRLAPPPLLLVLLPVRRQLPSLLLPVRRRPRQRPSLDTVGGFVFSITTTLLQPFNGLFSRTTWVSRYQKGKTNLDFTGARDSEWQWHQLSHIQVCTSLQTDNHASTPPLCFLQAGCPSCRPTNSVKALKALIKLRFFKKKLRFKT